MGLKLIVILLAVIDFALLGYVLYYYQEIYKKGIEKTDKIVKRARDKFMRNLPVENKVSEDNKETMTISVNEKVKFDEAFEKLSDEQKSYYQEICDYALSFKNTNTYSYVYDKRIRVGQRKTLAIISIKKECLVVKFKMGSLKINDELEPLQLKPIKVVVKNKDDVIEVKHQIDLAYNKQTGAINVSVEGDK